MTQQQTDRVFKIGVQAIGYVLLTAYGSWQIALGVLCISIGTLIAAKLSVEKKLGEEE